MCFSLKYLSLWSHSFNHSFLPSFGQPKWNTGSALGTMLCVKHRHNSWLDELGEKLLLSSADFRNSGSRALCAYYSSQSEWLSNVALDGCLSEKSLCRPNWATLDVLGLLCFKPPLAIFYPFVFPFMALSNLLLVVIQLQKDPGNIANLKQCSLTAWLCVVHTQACRRTCPSPLTAALRKSCPLTCDLPQSCGSDGRCTYFSSFNSQLPDNATSW